MKTRLNLFAVLCLVFALLFAVAPVPTASAQSRPPVAADSDYLVPPAGATIQVYNIGFAVHDPGAGRNVLTANVQLHNEYTLNGASLDRVSSAGQIILSTVVDYDPSVIACSACAIQFDHYQLSFVGWFIKSTTNNGNGTWQLDFTQPLNYPNLPGATSAQFKINNANPVWLFHQPGIGKNVLSAILDNYSEYTLYQGTLVRNAFVGGLELDAVLDYNPTAIVCSLCAIQFTHYQNSFHAWFVPTVVNNGNGTWGLNLDQN